MEFACSKADLRKCYGRAMLCSFLILVSISVAAAVLMLLYDRLTAGLPLDETGHARLWLLVNAVVSYLPPLVVIPLVMRKMPTVEKPAVCPLPPKELAIAVPFCIGALYLFAYLTEGLIAAIEYLTGMETMNALEVLDGLPLGMTALFTVVIAPICEEFLFRKLFLNRCRALGDVSAILLSAAAFALMHQNLYQLLYAFAAGVCLGSIAILTGRIRECILVHACVNSLSVLVMLEWGDLWLGCIGLLMMACIAFAIYLFCKRWGRYRFDPGPLPYLPAEKRRACRTSPCFWICGGLALMSSVAAIFLV